MSFSKWVHRTLTVDLLTGLGIGVGVTALVLAPSDSVPGDAYYILAICGGALLLAATVYRWALARRAVAQGRQNNLAGLHKSVKTEYGDRLHEKQR